MNLQLFQFDEARQMRAFLDPDGTPWMCAPDLTRALGYANGPDAVSKHCKEKGIAKRYTPTSGGTQLLTYLSEANLYRLVLRSKLPDAERFQDWVVEDVLPSIRRTGKYDSAAALLPQSLPEALRMLADSYEQAALMSVALAEAEPKIKYYDTVADSKDAVPMRDVAQVLNIKDLGRNKLFARLREMKLLDKANKPYQIYIDRGYFRVVQRSFQKPNGETGVATTTLVLQKGIEYLIDKLTPKVG
jgi:prophage antirepressor-like protein